ncbi:exopolysaccharide biosynthesis protein [Beijerinckia indica]|uniref:Exopolysaccharide synthesis ExoD n=1 Tax=Beijerinckia indica subsp. indica (strain ATCC 9039 / DSM 1715 / NCIMB 8712) TaxID=395963 RepID=B2ICP4_BEII9|nr:exopolysaccharide biosynthesis protein [Beijerinckia indica]ACB95318.1 Exopolysaccharide synthesis ExoD [Beijerinckia indica subsp. indica ATCC 9039]
MVEPTSTVLSSNANIQGPSVRASQVLREILSKNPKVEHFSVKHILDSIGHAPNGTSLMFFSMPGIVPMPGTSDLAGVPAGMIAGQMIAGKSEFKLPKFILEKSVPRRSLAVIIHIILPFLEKAEMATKPRLIWANHPAAQRILGVLLFLLALAIAFPMFGFNLQHAAAIFTISLGMVENDGLVILIGVIAGIASLVLFFSSFSCKALRKKTLDIMKTLSAKFSFDWMGMILKKLGSILINVLSSEWTRLLSWWNPEAPARRTASKKAQQTSKQKLQKRSAIAHNRKRADRSVLRAKTKSVRPSPSQARAAIVM